MKPKWDSVVTATLVACALVTTGLVARRELSAPSATSTQAATQKSVFIQNWRSEFGRGMTLGPTAAPVRLIEFADFECPACGDFHKKLKLLREHYPTQVSIVYMHFPIQGHRFALPAARVAECAGDQGRFEAMHDQLFEGQESFGLRPWSDYATAAGVPDIAAFNLCIKRIDPVPRIEEDRELGTKLDLKGTPTLIVNGWMLARPPTVEELDAMVKAILAGKPPVPPTKS